MVLHGYFIYVLIIFIDVMEYNFEPFVFSLVAHICMVSSCEDKCYINLPSMYSMYFSILGIRVLLGFLFK